MSLITPPPTAVTSPSTATPKMSIFFENPTIAPEAAKAIVPNIVDKVKNFDGEIIFTFVQPEGKKMMPALAFANGTNLVGKVFE